MELITNWDLASDSSRHSFFQAKLEVDRGYGLTVKDQQELSIDRKELKKIFFKEFKKLGKYAEVHETYSLAADWWYGVYEFETFLVCISFYSRHAYVEISAEKIEVAESALQRIMKALPPIAEPDQNHVNFDFYMLGADGRTAKIVRSLQTPSWDEIQSNYQKDTQKQLNDLVNLNPKTIGDGGKLILLHGTPGLGKSYAIRALMRATKEWAKPSYLMDPEKFFASPPYMFDIILSNPSGSYYDPEHFKDKWRLIIAEDSDEFLRADAKERSGQGLSRLLNLADGILGQGMKVIFLLTTNEPLQNLHPAVIRPGRCIANIEFKPFDSSEAQTWLGEPLAAYKNYTLAELYDMKRTQQQIKEEKVAVATGQYL